VPPDEGHERDQLALLAAHAARAARVEHQTLRLLLAMAYGTPFPVPLPDERIVGGPTWLAAARFAVDARVERPPDPATAGRDIGFMLRTLLADRFAVRVRFEPRPQPVYTLVRTQGPRRTTLRVSERECTKGGCGISGAPGRFELRGATLDLLSLSLAEIVGRPVVNRTGLTGAFDGALEWAPSPEEAAVWIILFSRMLDCLKRRRIAMEATAAGIEAETVMPANKPR